MLPVSQQAARQGFPVLLNMQAERKAMSYTLFEIAYSDHAENIQFFRAGDLLRLVHIIFESGPAPHLLVKVLTRAVICHPLYTCYLLYLA
jgi:hypothetical protein